MQGNIKSFEKVVTSYITATFENQLHQLCHDIFRYTYRNVPAIIFPKIQKAIEQGILPPRQPPTRTRFQTYPVYSETIELTCI